MKIIWEIVNEYEVEFENETLKVYKPIPVKYLMLLKKYYQPQQVLVGKEALWNENN